MAGRRLREYPTVEVELSPSLRVLITGRTAERGTGKTGRHLRDYPTAEVELSSSLRALIGGDRVILFDRARGATVLTLREAQVLAAAVEHLPDGHADQAVMIDRMRGATTMSMREVRALASAVGTTDKVDLAKRGSG